VVHSNSISPFHHKQEALKTRTTTNPIKMMYLKNTADFDALINNETKLVVIDFTATW